MNRLLFLFFVSAAAFLLPCSSEAADDRLQEMVSALCADSLAGRKAGSPGEMAAAGYIYRAMEDAGLVMATPFPGDIFTLQNGQDTLTSANVIGISEGYDPLLKNEIIVVGAHYDGTGNDSYTVDGMTVERLNPGADDNASGVAALLEIASAVRRESFLFRRTVIFVAFGASRDEYLGSWYFTHARFGFLDGIKMMVCLESLGSASPFLLFTTSDRRVCDGVMEELSKSRILVPSLTGKDAVASDHRMFHSSGYPVFLFTCSDGTRPDPEKDIPESLDYGRMDGICRYVKEFIKSYASMDRIPETVLSSSFPGGGDGTVYGLSSVDVPPAFMKGDIPSFLEKWVYAYVKYPHESVSMGIQGTVNVSFVVGADGNVTDVRIEKGLDEYIDREVLKVIEASPKWKAAQKDGRKVSVKITVPVEFRLR